MQRINRYEFYELLSKSYVMFFSKVENVYYPYADVTPLFLTPYDQNYDTISFVPIMDFGGSVKPRLKIGDVVLCGTAKSGISQIAGEPTPINKNTQDHQLADTFIIGGFSGIDSREDTDTVELRVENGFILVGKDKIVVDLNGTSVSIIEDKESKKSKILIKGEVEITGDVKVMGNVDAVEVTAGEIPLSTHGHGAAPKPTDPILPPTQTATPPYTAPEPEPEPK